jgi:uncharacterized coiled-coil DUF342 family protein
VSEYLDRLIESLEREVRQGRADMRRQPITTKANRDLVGHVNRIVQRLETLKRLQSMETMSVPNRVAEVRAVRKQARSSRRVKCDLFRQ